MLAGTLGEVDLGAGPARHDLDREPRRELLVDTDTGHRAGRRGDRRHGAARREAIRSATSCSPRCARFGSVALENARLPAASRETIARLESMRTKSFVMVLSVHEIAARPT